MDRGLAVLLARTVELGGSDLHLSAGSPPQVRIDGHLRRLDLPVLTGEQIEALSVSALTSDQRRAFEQTWELDFAMGNPGIGRFRCNLFRQQGTVAAAYRVIPARIPSFDDLGLPPVVAHLADRPRGLVLVTGSTGSGKSTTLAAIVDRVNETRAAHVLTIEDPIEFRHAHKRALVSQRELHVDTRGFAAALRAALREDPDVVLVGELRDQETMAAALKLSETGHLTLGTLHTNSAAGTITRLIDAFPASEQAQVRTQLSLVLEGVVSQALVPRATGSGRVAALEVLVATAAIRTLIRDDKVHQIYGVMQAGQGQHGMKTMNQALAELIERRLILRDDALRMSPRPDELIQRIGRDASACVRGGDVQPWPGERS